MQPGPWDGLPLVLMGASTILFRRWWVERTVDREFACLRRTNRHDLVRVFVLAGLTGVLAGIALFLGWATRAS